MDGTARCKLSVVQDFGHQEEIPPEVVSAGSWDEVVERTLVLGRATVDFVPPLCLQPLLRIESTSHGRTLPARAKFDFGRLHCSAPSGPNLSSPFPTRRHCWKK